MFSDYMDLIDEKFFDCFCKTDNVHIFRLYGFDR